MSYTLIAHCVERRNGGSIWGIESACDSIDTVVWVTGWAGIQLVIPPAVPMLDPARLGINSGKNGSFKQNNE